jgi:hypothetical protein
MEKKTFKCITRDVPKERASPTAKEEEIKHVLQSLGKIEYPARKVQILIIDWNSSQTEFQLSTFISTEAAYTPDI